MTRSLAAIRRAAVATIRSLAGRDIFVLAAAIAYATVLSFFPLLIGLIALVSPFVDPAGAAQMMVRTLAPDLPPGVADMVRGTLDAAIRARVAAGALAIAGLVWAATAGAGFLRQGLNRMLDAPDSPAFWRHLGTELAMVATAGTLIVLSVVGSALVNFLRGTPTVAGIAGALRASPIGVLAAGLVSWVLSGTAFVVLYRFLPDRRVRRRSLIIGGLVATVLFEMTKRLFFWYLLTLGRYPLVYGPLAGIVVFMVWMYFTALITLIGAAVIRQQETPAPPDHLETTT